VPPVTLPDPGRSAFDYAAWLVDLDGTLYRHFLVRAMMAVELVLWGRSAIKILRIFRREQERMRRAELLHDRDPFQLQVARTAQRLGIPAGDVAAVVDKWMFRYPGRWLRSFRRRAFLERIASFRAGGGKTALVSDYPARSKLTAMGAVGLFDIVVACGEHDGPSALKPNPAGLVLAAERLNVAPQDCLVIGDRRHIDGEAARRAGMAFQLVNSRWRTF
jgi:FMN phosphatase YigB (HAD superfamily)